MCLVICACFCVSSVSAWNTFSDDDKDFCEHPSKEKIYDNGHGQHEAMVYEACIRAGFSEDTAVKIMGYAGYPDTSYVDDEWGSHIWPADSSEKYEKRKPWGWHKVAEKYMLFRNAATKNDQIKWAGCILHYISDSACPYHSSESWKWHMVITRNHRNYENYISENWNKYSKYTKSLGTYTTKNLDLSNSDSIRDWYRTAYGYQNYEEYDKHNLMWLKENAEFSLLRAQNATNTIAKMLYREMMNA